MTISDPVTALLAFIGGFMAGGCLVAVAFVVLAYRQVFKKR